MSNKIFLYFLVNTLFEYAVYLNMLKDIALLE